MSFLRRLAEHQAGVTPWNSEGLQFKDSLEATQRLERIKKLSIHSGCVNTVVWDETGRYLLSGSDDQRLIISDPFKEEDNVLFSIRSGHRANIFSAKFLPFTDSNYIVSCSGDGSVILTDVEHEETHGTFVYKCHEGTTYEVCPIPRDSYTFLSCGEDGTVRFYDRRKRTTCGPCNENIVVDSRRAVCAMDVSGRYPHMLAIGCSDGSCRLFDMRMFRAFEKADTNLMTGLQSCFCPSDQIGKTRRITSVDFSEDGAELLVSFSSDYVYLIDVFNYAESPIELNLARDESRPLKKVRLRGDWSDTGPQARPIAGRPLPGPAVDQTPSTSTPAEDVAASEPSSSSSGIATAAEEVLSLQHQSGGGGEATSASATTPPDPEPRGRSMMQRFSNLLSVWLEQQLTGDDDDDDDDNDEGAGSNENTATTTESNNDAVNRPQPFSTASDSSEPVISRSLVEQFEHDSESSTMEQSSDSNEDAVVQQNNPNSEGTPGEIDPNPEALASPNDDSEAANAASISAAFEVVRPLAHHVQTAIANFPFGSAESGSDHGTTTEGMSREDDVIAEFTATIGVKFNVTTRGTCCSTVEVGVETSEGPFRNEDDSVAIPSEQTESQKMEPECSSLVPAQLPTSQSVDLDEPEPMDSCFDGSTSELRNDIDTVEPAPSTSSSSSSQFRPPLVGSSVEEDTEMAMITSASGGDIKLTTRSNIPLGQKRSAATFEEESYDESEDVLPKTGVAQEAMPSGIDKGSTENEQAGSTRSDAVEEEIPQDPGVEASSSGLLDRGGLFAFRVLKPRRHRQSSSQISPHQSDEVASTSTSAAPLPADESSSASSTVAIEEPKLGFAVDKEQSTRDTERHRKRKDFIERLEEDAKKRQQRKEEALTALKRAPQMRCKAVFKGHRNARTMLKQACFWGTRFIMSGSDCGHIFVWDRRNLEVVMLLEADRRVVNTVQPHPTMPLLASSGIDYDIKLWAPVAAAAEFDTVYASSLIERNKDMLEETRDTVTIPAAFMIRMLASMNRVKNLRRQRGNGQSTSSAAAADGTNDSTDQPIEETENESAISTTTDIQVDQQPDISQSAGGSGNEEIGGCDSGEDRKGEAILTGPSVCEVFVVEENTEDRTIGSVSEGGEKVEAAESSGELSMDDGGEVCAGAHESDQRDDENMEIIETDGDAARGESET